MLSQTKRLFTSASLTLVEAYYSSYNYLTSPLEIFA